MCIDAGLQKKYNKMFVFRMKTRFMLSASNIVFTISPKLYYTFLEKYYR